MKLILLLWSTRVAFDARDTAEFRKRHPRSQVTGSGWFEFDSGEGDLVGTGGAAVGQESRGWCAFMLECRQLAGTAGARNNPAGAPTLASLFTGGGGWEFGAIGAGYRPRWGVELDARIAKVCDDNLARAGVTGHVTHPVSVLDLDPHTLERVDTLCASPVCKSVSAARRRAGLVPREDAEIGRAVIRYLEVLLPRVLLVENATMYRSHPAFLAIVAAAERLGYVWDLRLVDADGYGVPQARKRMIARFVRGDLLPPWPKHTAPENWLQAIRDLIPSFPVQALAPWQVARIDRHKAHGHVGKYPLLVSSNHASSSRFAKGEAVLVTRNADEPAWTIVASYSAMSQTRVLLKNGRVLGLTPRAFARLQTFPDTYLLPRENALATTIVGNAVPPRLAEAILRGMIRR